MSRRGAEPWTLSEAVGAVAAAVTALAAAAVVALALAGCSAEAAGSTSTWPESAEFSTLESGQDRFSTHDTNLDYWHVVVDHSTGVQYLYRYKYGVTPLLAADGSPLRVAEAG